MLPCLNILKFQCYFPIGSGQYFQPYYIEMLYDNFSDLNSDFSNYSLENDHEPVVEQPTQGQLRSKMEVGASCQSHLASNILHLTSSTLHPCICISTATKEKLDI